MIRRWLIDDTEIHQGRRSLITGGAALAAYASLPHRASAGRRGPAYRQPSELTRHPGTFGMTPRALRNSFRAAADVKAGRDDWRIMIQDDSTGFGANANGLTDTWTNGRNLNFAAKSKPRIEAAYPGVEVSTDAWFGDGNSIVVSGSGTTVTTIDSRLTFSGTSWTPSATTACIGGSAIGIGNGVTPSTSDWFMFSPDLSCTHVTIFFRSITTSLGSFDIFIDGSGTAVAGLWCSGGGASVNTNQGPGNGAMRAVDVSLGSSGIHTIKIAAHSATSTSGTDVIGMVCRDSTKKRIILYNTAAASWTSATWITKGNGTVNWTQGAWPGTDGTGLSTTPSSQLPAWLQSTSGPTLQIPNYARLGCQTVIWGDAINDYHSSSGVTLQQYVDNEATVYAAQRNMGADVVKLWPHATMTAGMSGTPPGGSAITPDTGTELTRLQYKQASFNQAKVYDVPVIDLCYQGGPYDTWPKLFAAQPTWIAQSNFHLLAAGYDGLHAQRITDDFVVPVLLAA